MATANVPPHSGEWLLPVLEVAQNDIDAANTIVAGFVRMLLDGRFGDLTEKQREFLLQVQKAVGQARSVTRQLKAFRDFEKGTARFDGHSIDLAPMLEEIVASLPAFPGGDSTISMAASSSEAQVFGDREHLRAAFTSLIDQMRRELSMNREVLVRITRRTWNGDPMVWITVAANDWVDAIAGLEVEELRAFVRFYNFSLLLAQRIVAAHHGYVWFSVAQELPDGAGLVIALPEFVSDERPSAATAISPVPDA